MLSINKYIQENSIIKINEKNKYGEVFTPQSQIDIMLDTLPKHIWNNPNLKWLDPCAGIGNFPIRIILKLNETLKHCMPNNNERLTHILKNMIYMVEKNPSNVEIIKSLFGKNHEINVYCHDFLTWIPPKNITFDIIIANPPYNNERRYKKKNSETLWDKFVSIIISNYLNEGNYFSSIHPPRWRKPNSKLFKKMTHYNSMLYLEMHHFSDGLNLFGAETRFDWYIIRGGKIKHDTFIKDIHGENHFIDLSTKNFIPNFLFNIIYSMETRNRDKLCDLIYDRTMFGSDKKWTNQNPSSEFKYPLIHSTPKKGVRYYYSNTLTPPVRRHTPMFGVSKVIFGEGGAHNPVIDMEGKYGMTGGAMAIRVNSEKEAKQIYYFLLSPMFKKIVDAMSVGYFRIDWRMFLYINILL